VSARPESPWERQWLAATPREPTPGRNLSLSAARVGGRSVDSPTPCCWRRHIPRFAQRIRRARRHDWPDCPRRDVAALAWIPWAHQDHSSSCSSRPVPDLLNSAQERSCAEFGTLCTNRRTPPAAHAASAARHRRRGARSSVVSHESRTRKPPPTSRLRSAIFARGSAGESCT